MKFGKMEMESTFPKEKGCLGLEFLLSHLSIDRVT